LANRARVAVVGATGTVGSQIADLIGKRGFPRAELKLFGPDDSGRAVESGEQALPVARFNDVEDLAASDIAFLAIERSKAAEIIQAQPGPILIDLSAATMSPTDVVPLVAPGLVARDKIGELSRSKILGVPHPSAQVIATILQALGAGGFAAAAVLLSASTAGHQSIANLFQQSADLLNARLDLEGDEPQLAFNVFPAPGARELAAVIAAQVRTLAGDSCQLTLDLVRVPAFHGSAVALFLPTGDESNEWAARLRSAPGIILLESDEAAGLVDAVSQEAVIVRMTQKPAGAALWCAFDAARLAALTAVWIAEAVSEKRVA
jgi:aspartate-semialdehyde dehydrogenase